MLVMQIWLVLAILPNLGEQTLLYTEYREIFVPVLFSNSNVANYFSLNTIVSGQIQYMTKLLASEEGQKLHRPEISLYTVLYMCFY